MVNGMPIEAVEADQLKRPPVAAVVDLFKVVKRAAERGSVVAVGIGTVLDTMQINGCSRSRSDIPTQNLLKAAAHLTGVCVIGMPLPEMLERDVWDPPQANVIGLIQARMQAAQDGHVLGVVFALVGSDWTIGTASATDGTPVVDGILVAARGELAHAIMHAMSAVPEGPREPAIVEGMVPSPIPIM